MKLLIRGGSISAGKGVLISYADLLKSHLAARGIEVINVSREGDTSFEGVWTYHDDIDPIKPDLLLLHFGIDDIYRPVYRSEFKENLVQLVRICRNRFNPQIFLSTSLPFDSDYEMQSALIYYRTIREVAYDLRCFLIPVHFLIAEQLDDNRLKLSDIVQNDDRYPNETGHRILFEIISKRILDHAGLLD